MPLTNNINAYADIASQLKEIRAQGGAEVVFTTFGKSVHWVARVYKYRRLLFEAAQATTIKGFTPSTPIDDLVITHDRAKRSAIVRVEFGMKLSGKIRPISKPSEGVVPLTNDLMPVDDDLVAAARALAEREGE